MNGLVCFQTVVKTGFLKPPSLSTNAPCRVVDGSPQQ